MPDGSPPTESDPQTGGVYKVPARLTIVWVVIFAGIVLLMVFKDRMAPAGEVLTQYQFEELVDAGRIAHATISYDAERPALNEIVGRYYKTENDHKIEVPFRARVRLAGGLERRLLTMPEFDAREPNRVLQSFILSVLPILLIAVLIWFFFIRQIKKAAKNPSAAEYQARAIEQQNRQDKILDKWDAQLKRLDAILDKLDGGANR